MSILPFFLLVGVAASRHISYYADDGGLQPISARSRERRICAELCMSGLGGEPCGDSCVDLMPAGLPPQSLLYDSSEQSSLSFRNNTRRKACPTLCENGLGYPLCNCDPSRRPFKTDFSAICEYFCESFDYQIYGCKKCRLYKGLDGARIQKGDEVNWEVWCQKVCQEGEGGAACNCDLLPMSIKK